MSRIGNAVLFLLRAVLESAVLSVILCAGCLLLYILTTYAGVLLFGLTEAGLHPIHRVLSYPIRHWILLWGVALFVRAIIDVAEERGGDSGDNYSWPTSCIDTEIKASDYIPKCPKCRRTMSWTDGELNCQVERYYCSHCWF